MNAPDIVVRNYLDRCHEYGEATVLAAIDQLRNAKFWHGKTIGLPTMLDEQKFQKLIDGEYDNLFAKESGKPDKSKGCVPVHEADQKKFDEWGKGQVFLQEHIKLLCVKSEQSVPIFWCSQLWFLLEQWGLTYMQKAA